MNIDRDRTADEEPALPGVAAFRRDVPPQRDLWPGIEARIRAQDLRRRRGRARAVASLAATLLLGSAVGFWLRTPRPAPLPATAQFAELERGAARLHPETRALVKVNLKIVDDAQAQIRRALKEDPDAAYLKSLLAATQRQKQELHVVLADAQ
jgi:hypothetical protein